jgi:uncharacterized protein (DUF1330 family)
LPAYIIATAHVTDPARYQAYYERLVGVMQRYGGEMLLNGKVKDVLEGDSAPGERVTVLQFPDESSARAYIGSVDYQDGKRLRQGGGPMVMRIMVNP